MGSQRAIDFIRNTTEGGVGQLTARTLGLPETTAACLFDLDGVLTSTAEVHQEAWKQIFDAFLRQHVAPETAPFTTDDYNKYVDGRPRSEGVSTFLRSRGIELPEGSPEDAPGGETVHALGNRKNDLVLRLLNERGVQVYPGSLRYLNAVRERGLSIGVVTSSANAAAVLDGAGLSEFIRARVDGRTIELEGLRGKPAPDSFLACAEKLGAIPSQATVFEDAVSGVRAASAGGFGCIIGVDRAGQAEDLRSTGADVVVSDLARLLED